ncbi:MAG: LapA family protein [Micromonosporaceae bacterium]|nr:LapA family protein [Micromonosporaceae bacterium]
MTIVSAALVFLLLLIFILQNGQRAQISFLGAHGYLPMGIALLLAVIFGVLLVAIPGTARIMQLRTLGRRRGGKIIQDRAAPPK